MKTKTLKTIGEFGLIDYIKKSVRASSQVILGIGDDAAVYQTTAGTDQLITTDAIVEGVDFDLKKTTLFLVGRKALAINLSDIAAMGGVPKHAVVTLIMPRNMGLAQVKEFFRGLKKIADQFKVNLIGGDISRGPKLICSIAVIGEVRKNSFVTRTGAKPGDLIAVTGTFGGSILGRHASFPPRVQEGQFLAQHGVSSMIDVSDGLIQDLNHLVSENNLGYDLDLNAIPINSAAQKLSKKTKKTALDHALTDGEDFELLFTTSQKKWNILLKQWSRKFKTQVTIIGKITRNSKNRMNHKGFTHF